LGQSSNQIMQTVVIVIHLMIVLTMVGLVLLQKSEGGGLGMGGGAGSGFLSSRGTANVLTRTTAILAAAFFATSLLLSIIAGIERKPRSILDTAPRSGPAAPAAPGTPLGGPGGGVLDQLRGGAQQPQPPAGPQVPRSQ
jgi:preprotein translocase subunit SecG